MRNVKFFFDGFGRLLVKLPVENWDGKLDITLELPQKLKGKYLQIFVDDEESSIPVKNDCSEEECNACKVIYCPVYQEYATLRSVDILEEEKEDTRPVITGHENCRLGDCWYCHNVCCGIQQGVSPMPERPEDC